MALFIYFPDAPQGLTLPGYSQLPISKNALQ